MNIKDINSKKSYDFSCIYLWTNKSNNKKYVGQTRHFYNRMMQYRNGKFNKYMKSAILKYGIDNFEIEKHYGAVYRIRARLAEKRNRRNVDFSV